MLTIFPIARMLGKISDNSYTKQQIINKSAVEQAQSLGINVDEIVQDVYVGKENKDNISNSDINEKSDKKIKIGEVVDSMLKATNPMYRMARNRDEDLLVKLNTRLACEISKKLGDDFRVGGSKLEKWLASDNKCTDGVDDGKISFWSKAGNFIEGFAKTIAGSFYNILKDPKKLFVTVSTGLAMLAFSTTAVGAVAVPIIGILGGAMLVKKGIETIVETSKAASLATTDAEAKDIWEEYGQAGAEITGGVLAIGLGAKEIKGISSSCEVNSCKNSIKGKANDIKNGAKISANNNTEIFKSRNEVFKEIIKSIFDPGNIDAD